MPELAPYTIEVLGAYAAALGLLGVLVGAVSLRARRVRRQLDEMEQRRGK